VIVFLCMCLSEAGSIQLSYCHTSWFHVPEDGSSLGHISTDCTALYSTAS